MHNFRELEWQPEKICGNLSQTLWCIGGEGWGIGGGGLPSYKSAISCCMHVFNNSEKEFLDNKSVQIQRK